MRQVDAELRRFFARRIVQGTFVVIAFIILLSVAVSTARGHRGNDLSFGAPSGQFVNPGGPDQIPPQFEDFNDTRMNVGNNLENTLAGTGVALMFAGFVLGASFVGAEFHVGSLTTQRLFESRRGRVHGVKAAAVAIGSAVVALALMGVVAGSMYLGSALHGVVQGVDGTFVVDRLGQALRIAGAVAAGATMTYCVTLVGRRSSAGMIAFFVQYPLLFLLDPAKLPFGLLSHYAPVRGLIVVVDPSGLTDTAVHTLAGATVLVAVWLVVLMVACGAVFARAEVR